MIMMSINIDENEPESDSDTDDVMKSKCGTMKWKPKPTRIFRQPPWNILKEESGIPDSVQFATMQEAFSVFVNEYQ